MAKTKISDVIVPELFAQYIIEQSTATSKLIASGVLARNSILDTLVTAGGRTMNVPFWNFITGDDEVLSDGTELTPDKVSASQDVAVLLMRGKSWSANDLAGALAGDDPMMALGTMVADWWNIKQQATLISTLKGVFAATSMSGHIYDGSAANIGGNVVLKAKQLLGDNAPKLNTLVMHSATYTELQSQNLIEYIQTSTANIALPTYLGYNVIFDDSMPIETTGSGETAVDVYTSYLMGSGVIGYGEGIPVSFVPVETDRDSLASDDILINRRAFVMHPYGVKWKGTAAGATPTNTELATGTNWEKVYDSKNLPIIKITHKVGA